MSCRCGCGETIPEQSVAPGATKRLYAYPACQKRDGARRQYERKRQRREWQRRDHATAWLRNPTLRRHDEAAYIRAMRDDPCVYCGEPAEALDHIVPQSAGGDESWENMAPVCKSCNSQKCTRSLLTHLLARRVDAEIEPLIEERNRILESDANLNRLTQDYKRRATRGKRRRNAHN